jgi:hypothetical protein
MNHQILLYDTPKILNDLGLSANEFLEIAILCGTDYNDGYHSLIKTLELHKEYKRENEVICQETSRKGGFYNWFIQTTHLNETKNFNTICNIFDISNYSLELEQFVDKFKNEVSEKMPNISKIKEIMVNYGFIFI